MNKKNILISLMIILVIAAGLGVYFWQQSNTGKNNQKVDETTTGSTIENSGHALNNGISFQYPEKLTTQYIFTQEWPPTVEVQAGTYSCIETPKEASQAIGIIKQRMVDDRIYCVEINNEGAAGSLYSSFVYTTPKNGKLIKVSFVLRYVNCENYDKDQSQICASEREAFDLDATVDRIVQTVQWNSSLINDDLASQLSQCLIMSDMASKEKCDELLQQIIDFDSCVMAGFSIRKLNPAQCQTPDGRTFVQETNSAWEQAVLAVNNCEVEKVYQKHSRTVTLTLKNGNRLIATEPKIDDIITIAETVEPKCGKIPMATE